MAYRRYSNWLRYGRSPTPITRVSNQPGGYMEFSPPGDAPAAPPEPYDPWLSMWLQPRATVRHLVEQRPRYGVLLLTVLGGIAGSLDRMAGRDAGDSMALPMVLVFALLFGPIGGLIGLYLGAWLIGLTGRWIGGTAETEPIRTALAWGNLPNVAGLLLWLPALALVGREMFTAATPALEAQPWLAVFLLPLGLAWFTLGAWSLVLVVKGIGEVQGFTAWKALGNLLLAGLLVAVPIALLAVGLAVMAGSAGG